MHLNISLTQAIQRSGSRSRGSELLFNSEFQKTEDKQIYPREAAHLNANPQVFLLFYLFQRVNV